MTSRSSFCNLLRENFKRRIWSFAITMLFFLFYFPISSMLTADGYLAGSETMSEFELARTKMYIFNAFKSQHGQSGGIVFFLMVFAILMAASAFGYLHDRNKTDFYHSLPISRMKLYMANIINSLVITLVPYLIMALISAGITGVRTGYGECIPYALTNFLINSGFFVLLFSVSVIAMLLTGHRIVGILGTLILYFWGAFIMSLFANDLMSSFFNTFYSEPGHLSFLQQFVSPVYWCVSYTQSYGAGFRSSVALLAGILFILVGSKIYAIRRSEAAGQAMAFKLTEAPIKFILVIPVAIFSGMVFQSMIGGSDFWAIFGIVVGALLSHCVIEIIYNLDFKKLFDHRAHMLAALIVSLGLFSIYRFDLFGYDSYLPDEDKVESAGIYSYALDQIYATTNDIEYEDSDLTVTLNENYISDKDVVDRMKLTSLEDVYGLAEHGIAEAGISQGPDGPDCYPRNVLLGWHLKNGKTVYRQYYLNFRTAHDELSAIHDSIEYKEAIYPVLNLSETDISDIVGVNYQDALGYHHIFFNDDKDEAVVKYAWSGYGVNALVSYSFAKNAEKLDGAYYIDEEADLDYQVSAALGYATPDILFGPIDVRAGYTHGEFADVPDHSINSAAFATPKLSGILGYDSFDQFALGLSWGSLDQGPYLAAAYVDRTFDVNLYGTDYTKSSETKITGYELLAGYTFTNGIFVVAGYEVQDFELEDLDLHAATVPVYVNWQINPNLNAWVEARFDAGSDDDENNDFENFDAITGTDFSENIYSAGLRYSF